MTLYNNFIGIDIGKFNFVTAIYGNKQTKEYQNNGEGIANFIKDHQHLFAEVLCVLETTGGYEMELLLTLCSQNIMVHRADCRKVKNFIRSNSSGAKTDALDAKALALYGFERAVRLEVFQPQSVKALRLYELIQRRFDLKQILVAEKNRLQSPKTNFTKSSCQSVIEVISLELETITTLIEEDELLQAKKEVLKTIPGIGAGVAPRSNDSGTIKGYRRTAHGRNCIKPTLFLSAMAARNSNSELKQFYEKMINRGKKKMVALTALMRKIIVIANAKLRDFNAECLAIKI